MCFNHPKTIPLSESIQKLSPQNCSLVPNRLETSGLDIVLEINTLEKQKIYHDLSFDLTVPFGL